MSDGKPIIAVFKNNTKSQRRSPVRSPKKEKKKNTEAKHAPHVNKIPFICTVTVGS